MIKKTARAALLTTMLAIVAATGSADNSGKIVVMPVVAADQSLQEGVAVITEIIANHFIDNRSVIMISPEQKESLAGAETGSRLQIIQTVAAKMKSDQALVFSLLRYRERLGDHYSVKDAASLAFDFKLIKVADGRTTCSGQYDETQESLTENILDLPQAFKRGFKWLTVKELAAEAVRERFATCPTLVSGSSQ